MREFIQIVTESLSRATVYHGTSYGNITSFDTNRNSAGRAATDGRKVLSFSTDRQFAADYAGKQGYVYTVSIPTHDLGDFRNPDHIKAVYEWRLARWEKWLEGAKAQYPDVWTPENIAKTRARDVNLTKIEAGEWAYWESRALWEAMGWRGSWMVERNASQTEAVNVAIINFDGCEILKVEPVRENG